MARLLHRVSVFEQAVASDGVLSLDLPTNPLSVILIALRPLNDTGTLGNYATPMMMAGALNSVRVIFQGAAIISMSGRDLLAYNYFRHGISPWDANSDDTNNERRCFVLPVLLGRFAYDVRSALPPSRRGELTLELDFDIADTGYDGMRVSVETVEMIGASPREAERKTTLTDTFGATGDNDIQLPGGNKLRGLLLFGTTSFGGATPVPSWGRVSLFLDGEQIVYSSTDFEVLHSLNALMGRQAPNSGAHTHRVDAGAGGATTEQTFSEQNVGSSGGFENYAWMDLDPTRDDAFSVDASKATSFFLRSNAESADAVRVISVERLPV